MQMFTSSATRPLPIDVRISADGIEAYLVTTPGAHEPASWTAEQIEAVLTANRIAVNDAVRTRIVEYLSALVSPQRGALLTGSPFLIARGVPPVEATDTHIRPPYGGAVEPGDLQPLASGTVIGHLVHGKHGSPGRTVFGTAISPQRSAGKPMRFGDGLRLDRTLEEAIVTTRGGLLVREGDMLRVVRLAMTEGDIAAAGTIDSPADVHVTGSVRDGARVRSLRSIVIGGSVEGCPVSSQGPLVVRGDVLGGGLRPRIRAGGPALLKQCDDVVILCDAGLEVQREMSRCEATIRGWLRVAEGTIVGGRVWAREGVLARTLGSASGQPTTIGVGAPSWYTQRQTDRARMLIAHRERAKALRDKLGPLMANVSRLTIGQREQVMQLLRRCEQIEEYVRVSTSEGITEDEIFQPAHPPRIDVTGTIHAGVRIRIGKLEATISSAIQGPVSIRERICGGVRSIACWRGDADEPAVLPSAFIPTDQLRCEGDAMLPPLEELVMPAGG